MRDSTREMLQPQNEAHALAIDLILCDSYINLDKVSLPWILNHIDCFVSLSRGNSSVCGVSLDPCAFSGHDDDVWKKFGQAIGNLQALERLCINISPEVLPIPDWEILTRILSHVRQRIMLSITPDEFRVLAWRAEDSRSFARAIRGHPTITRFENGDNFPYESLDVLCSALATLPALESVGLHVRNFTLRDGSVFANPESLTELLRVPTLRSVCFKNFSFTPLLCQATANAFIEGTAVTKLEFSDCSFSARECAAMMASSLSRNTSVSYIKVLSPYCYGMPDLAVNSTIQELAISGAVVSALGQNISLKSLSLAGPCCSMDESLCTAMQSGLEMNKTLESLEITHALLTDDNAGLWCRAFSFLRTNKSLKSLVVELNFDVTGPCLTAFRTDIAAMLQDNVSLESLSILTHQKKFQVEEYVALITALQHNTTLESIVFQGNHILAPLTDNEDKQIAVLLKKNFTLERLPNVDREGDVVALLRLNEAGRRYLIEEDSSSISKGVEVLGRVNNDINCIFLHLLENPTLCDRSVVEMVSDYRRKYQFKREQASTYKGKESRRRLA